MFCRWGVPSLVWFIVIMPEKPCISESTVHKHIEDAKKRFTVSTRIQLVVRSLFDARLTFADVMKEPDKEPG